MSGNQDVTGKILRYFESADDYRSVENCLKSQMGRINPLEDSIILKRAVNEMVHS
ncbi:MAG TPA: hypothetical protein VGI33_09875 [Paenibacillus sp.]